MTRGTSAYSPQPGTIPAKLISHLRSLPAGSEVSTSVVLDAIGHSGLKSIRTYMLPAIGAGLVACRRVVGEPGLVWSLGSGEPADAQATDKRPVDDDLSDLAGPPPNPEFSKASVFSMAQATGSGPVADGPSGRWPFKKGAEQAVPDVAPSPDPQFRCALFSDGVLMITSGGHTTELPAEHTRKLIHYLDRLGVPGDTGVGAAK